MKKTDLRAQFRYRFDLMMSKGTIAMIALLFAATMAAVLVIGVIAYFVADDGGFLYQLWVSLMHTLDAGTLAGNPTDNIPYLIMMSLATICGLFLTSILIGVIASGVEGRLNELKKGTSVVQEQGHTVIIGFNENIYSMLSELIEANSNRKKACIVVLGTQDKEEMEEAIAAHVPDTRTTRIICRSGPLYEDYSFERCSVSRARSMIVNIYDDAETIKSILALTAYLKNNPPLFPAMRIVAAIQDKQNVEAAQIAGEGQADIIYTKDTISRIIAHTCRQHGLSQVMVELFNFTGNELYIEHVPSLEGRTFRDALNCFSNATVVGIASGIDVKLNPPMETVIRHGDCVVLLEMDDGVYDLITTPSVDEASMTKVGHMASAENDNMIILGSNDKLPMILEEYDRYVVPGTNVVIVDDDFDSSLLSDYENLDVYTRRCTVDRELLTGLLTDDVDNVLILNDDSEPAERSDARTLLQLLLLRDIADRTGKKFAITTEMKYVDNQRLASRARVDDFVISFNITCLLMAQISENPRLLPLINDLLDEDGSEFYMKPAANYVRAGEKVNSYTLTESAARRGEIYVGYRRTDKNGTYVRVNPPKGEYMTLGEKDMVIVIAED